MKPKLLIFFFFFGVYDYYWNFFINFIFLFFFIVYFQIHDDLEKEPEYSGSGFGPDDEDSSSATHHNKPTSHHTNNAGYKPTNRKIKPQKSHNIDEIETGSGDKPDNDDEDDGIDDDDDEDEEEHTGGGVINTNNEHNVDEDDFVTEIKQTDLTTTTDDENIERQLHGFVYFTIIIFNFYSPSLIYIIKNTIQSKSIEMINKIFLIRKIVIDTS